MTEYWWIKCHDTGVLNEWDKTGRLNEWNKTGVLNYIRLIHTTN